MPTAVHAIIFYWQAADQNCVVQPVGAEMKVEKSGAKKNYHYRCVTAPNNAVVLQHASTKKPVDEAWNPARQGPASGPEGLRRRRFSRFCRCWFRYFFWVLPRRRFGFRNGFFVPVELVGYHLAADASARSRSAFLSAPGASTSRKARRRSTPQLTQTACFSGTGSSR